MNPEFAVHILNEQGVEKAKAIAGIFDTALNALKEHCLQGREFSLVKTKLEEACFFAKKSIANETSNQKQGE